MMANTLAILLLAALVLVVIVMSRSLRKTARGAVSSRDTLDNEAFSRRYFEGREARLASGIRAALAPYIPVDVSHAYPDDDLEIDLNLGRIEGMDARGFIAALERLYGIEIPLDEARGLRTLRHFISYVSCKLEAVEDADARQSCG